VIKAVVDTHTLIWWLFGNPNLSLTATTFINTAETEGNQIAISSVSLAEVVYLTEKGRIPAETFQQILVLMDLPASTWLEIAFDRKIADAMRSIDRLKIPDLHDRMIAATTLQQDVPLISRDAKIQVSGITTIW
jgi:PIN domain nuclease of toxin-antitoxin system